MFYEGSIEVRNDTIDIINEEISIVPYMINESSIFTTDNTSAAIREDIQYTNPY